MIESSTAKYIVASSIAACGIAAIQFLTDNSSQLGRLGVLALPGYLPAALVFPEGFHSESPYGFMALVVIFDGLLYGVPLMFLWKWWERKRKSHIRTK